MYVNRYLGDLLGVDPFRVRGSALRDWVREGDRGAVEAWEERPPGAEGVLRLELRRSSGVVVQVEAEAANAVFAGRRVSAFFVPVRGAL